MDVFRKFAAPVTLGLITATTTACEAEPPGLSIEVVSPAAGALVIVPFEVVVDTGVPLGPQADNFHHAHIWFGDDEAAYRVVESDTVRINNAPNGEQIMHVSLRNADHTPTGVDISIELTIVGGSD